LWSYRFLLQAVHTALRRLGTFDQGFLHFPPSTSPSRPERRRDSSVGVETRLRAGRPRSRGSIPVRGKLFFFVSPQLPDRLWCAFCTTGTLACFLEGKAAGAWSWPTHFYVVPMSRMVETYLHSPTRLHGVMRDSLGTGISLLISSPVKAHGYYIWKFIHKIWR
jgi:hypothetical protein